MITNKMRNFTKNRKLYLILCGVMLFSLFAETQVANSAAPKGIAVTEFTNIEFVDNPQCWKPTLSGTSIQYTNSCANTVLVDIVVTHFDGTQETFVMANGGKLVFLGGSTNVVHIIKEQP